MGGDNSRKWFTDPYGEPAKPDREEEPAWATKPTEVMPLVNPWRAEESAPLERMERNRGSRFRPGFGRRI